MSAGGALLTFVSVFVAALLAFYLDGLRERRARENWVREYLVFWRQTLESTTGGRQANEDALERIDLALSRWLELGASGVEPAWSDVDAINVNAAITFTPLLLDSGASAVPADLLHRMFVADATAPALLRRGDAVTRMFEGHVRPLVLARVTWLDAQERNAVELYRAEFRALRDHMRSYLDQLDRIRDELVGAGF